MIVVLFGAIEERARLSSGCFQDSYRVFAGRVAQEADVKIIGLSIFPPTPKVFLDGIVQGKDWEDY